VKPLFESLRNVTLLLACTFAGGHARAALACSLTGPGTLTGPYSSATNLDLQGSLTINCTRLKGDPKTATLWLGLNQVAGGTLARGGSFPDTLNVSLNRTVAPTTNLWTSGPAATTGAGGLAIALDFGTGNNLAWSQVFPLFMRVASSQTGKASGTYARTFTATLRSDSDTGAILSTPSPTFSAEAVVPSSCSFDASPVSFSGLNYVAFQQTALVAARNLQITCTRGSNYTLALDAGVGLLPAAGLVYQMYFTASGTTSSPTLTAPSAALQTYGLTLQVPAGQAGTCSTSTCLGTSTRTVTMTF
jgi:spore coat protein U-like protein